MGCRGESVIGLGRWNPDESHLLALSCLKSRLATFLEGVTLSDHLPAPRSGAVHRLCRQRRETRTREGACERIGNFPVPGHLLWITDQKRTWRSAGSQVSSGDRASFSACPDPGELPAQGPVVCTCTLTPTMPLGIALTCSFLLSSWGLQPARRLDELAP